MFSGSKQIGIARKLSFCALALSLCLAAANRSSVFADTGATDKPIAPAAGAPALPPHQWWVDDNVKPKLVILAIHGLGLHKGTYDAFGKEMSAKGIAVYAMDVRGFGAFAKDGARPKVDFDGCLTDVQAMLKSIHKSYPNLPVVLIGESMGGAIALRATAMNPDLVSGLVSSVPAGDRFNKTDQELKVALHALFSGFNSPMNVGRDVVKEATQKSDLRRAWEKDPMARMQMTPNELIAFNEFMKLNFVYAKKITDTPVLFIQGANDQLVRPAGTWKLCESLGTANKQLVMSKNSEHLIFEEGQFNPEDMTFVRSWLDRNVTALDKSAVASAKDEPNVASSRPNADTSTSNTTTASTAVTTTAAGAAPPASAPASSSASTTASSAAGNTAASTTVATIQTPSASGGTSQAQVQANSGIHFWIELYRNGKTYRCNNKTSFKSGDAIRFHVIPQTDGYAYVVMKESSSGKSSVLFPSSQTGTSNFLNRGTDYPLPYKTWLQFDKHPGTEKVSLLFSKDKIDPNPELHDSRYVTAYVSSDRTGAKDLVPTRMQLSWDDPTPVIIPDDFAGNSRLASVSRTNTRSSMVRLVSNSTGVLSVDIALSHQ